MLSHSVFFSLHDNSPAAVDRLVAACKTYLNGHPGTCFFAAGTLAGEYQRPVNDRAFDVALHVVFADRAVPRCLSAGATAPEVHRGEQGELEAGPGVRRVRGGEVTYSRASRCSPSPTPHRALLSPGRPAWPRRPGCEWCGVDARATRRSSRAWPARATRPRRTARDLFCRAREGRRCSCWPRHPCKARPSARPTGCSCKALASDRPAC